MDCPVAAFDREPVIDLNVARVVRVEIEADFGVREIVGADGAEAFGEEDVDGGVDAFGGGSRAWAYEGSAKVAALIHRRRARSSWCYRSRA
jgi:hypothetical protein